jgi:hypothetical protein
MKLTQLKDELDKGRMFCAEGSNRPVVFASSHGYCYVDGESESSPVYNWQDFLADYEDHPIDYEQVGGPLYDPDEKGSMPQRLHRALSGLADAKQGMEQAIHVLEYHLHQVNAAMGLLASIQDDTDQLRRQEHRDGE